MQETWNQNLDQAGSPDEESGQRKLDDLGVKHCVVDFVGDVQVYTNDFETPRVDRATYVCVPR